MREAGWNTISAVNRRDTQKRQTEMWRGGGGGRREREREREREANSAIFSRLPSNVAHAKTEMKRRDGMMSPSSPQPVLVGPPQTEKNLVFPLLRFLQLSPVAADDDELKASAVRKNKGKKPPLHSGMGIRPPPTYVRVEKKEEEDGKDV